jgi:hypothetical protein
MTMLKPAAVHFAGDPGPAANVLPDLAHLAEFARVLPLFHDLSVGADA